MLTRRGSVFMNDWVGEVETAPGEPEKFIARWNESCKLSVARLDILRKRNQNRCDLLFQC